MTFDTLIFYAPTANAIGGGETWVNTMAHAFSKEGFHVRVIARSHPSNPVEMRWPDGASPLFLRDVPHSAAVSKGLPSRGMRFLSALRNTSRWVADHVLAGWRPRIGRSTTALTPTQRELLLASLRKDSSASTLVICIDLLTGGDVASLAEELGRESLPRFVVQHHNNFQSLNKGQVREFRRIARSAVAVVALTDEDARLFRERGRIANATWATNPAPPVDWDAVEVPRQHAVITMSRLTRQKRLDLALRAWSLVADADKQDWKMLVYGTGPELPNLHRLVENLEVEDSTEFMGQTHAPASVFRRAAALVLSSDFEGWGLTIGEAAAVGTPTIAYDCAPGVRTQITNGVSGLLIKRRDVVGLARAIQAFINDEKLRNNLSFGAAHAVLEFSIDVTVERWKLLLDQWSKEQHQ